VLGLAQQLNFIQFYFQKGQHILRLDDDIKGLHWLNQPRPLIPFVKEMFQIAQEEGSSIWSIQPATTVFYCWDRVSIG
jgi:hypothetical protein